MKVSQISTTNFTGIKLANSSSEHAKYVRNVLRVNNVYVAWQKYYRTADNIESKRDVVDFIRKNNPFSNHECGFVFFPFSKETWIIGKLSFEQEIKKILDKHYIGSEVNLGI